MRRTARATILDDEALVDIAETLYNFRNAMDIDGIKNTLWQLVNRQAKETWKEVEGAEQRERRKITDWVEHHILFIALDINAGGKPALHLVNNSLVLGERWQSQLKKWGVEKGYTSKQNDTTKRTQ